MEVFKANRFAILYQSITTTIQSATAPANYPAAEGKTPPNKKAN
jgi:hypothetical protein